jgi:hypothetical protein
MRALVVVALLAAGCPSISPMVYTNGLPNFGEVEPGLYRTGCPTLAGWDYLKAIGVRTYVKLTFEDECAAGYAESIGIRVIRIEIPPGEASDVVLMRAPTQDQLHQLAAVLTDESLRPLAYGCLHDQDRGGIATGVLRLKRGWSKTRAYAEMLEHHFHPELVGLKRAWDDFQP